MDNGPPMGFGGFFKAPRDSLGYRRPGLVRPRGPHEVQSAASEGSVASMLPRPRFHCVKDALAVGAESKGSLGKKCSFPLVCMRQEHPVLHSEDAAKDVPGAPVRRKQDPVSSITVSSMWGHLISSPQGAAPWNSGIYLFGAEECWGQRSLAASPAPPW